MDSSRSQVIMQESLLKLRFKIEPSLIKLIVDSQAEIHLFRLIQVIENALY
jgi:regulator of sigma D